MVNGTFTAADAGSQIRMVEVNKSKSVLIDSTNVQWHSDDSHNRLRLAVKGLSQCQSLRSSYHKREEQQSQVVRTRHPCVSSQSLERRRLSMAWRPAFDFCRGLDSYPLPQEGHLGWGPDVSWTEFGWGYSGSPCSARAFFGQPIAAMSPADAWLERSSTQ